MDHYCEIIHSIVKEVVEKRRSGESQALTGHRIKKQETEEKTSSAEKLPKSMDLLDLLLTAELPSGENMPISAVEEESINFIAAGAETTSNLLSWIFYRMATVPGLWKRVRPLCPDAVFLMSNFTFRDSPLLFLCV